MSELKTYGLSKRDLYLIQDKVDNQKDYLEQNKITASNGTEKSLLDISYSANHSERYYSRILNKVDTFVSVNISKGHVPLFLTATLDGFFRDFMRGNYSRWEQNKAKYVLGKHIPNNDRNGNYLDLMQSEFKMTPKDLYKILGYQLHKFTKILGEIKRNNPTFSYSFIRVTEPHQDGTPHFHVLMYAPLEYVPQIYKAFIHSFPAPRNAVKLTKANTKGKSSRDGVLIGEGIYETHGFQTQIRSAAGYILKYILKSFTNLINKDEIDYLQAWYIKYRIPRIISTHTLVSQEVYHKISPLEPDWYYLTSVKNDANYYKNNSSIYFNFTDGDRVLTGNNGFFSIVNNDRRVSQYGAYNYSGVMALSKTFKFTIVKPKKFNPFPCYASFNLFNSLRKKYEYEIMVSEDKEFFLSFQSKDSFSIRMPLNQYIELDNEFISFGAHKSSFYEVTQNYLSIQASLHNTLVKNRGLKGGYMTERDYFFNELWSNGYDDTEYPLDIDKDETQEDMLNEIFQYA